MKSDEKRCEEDKQQAGQRGQKFENALLITFRPCYLTVVFQAKCKSLFRDDIILKLHLRFCF